MKMTSLVLSGCFIAATFCTTALALTVDQEVTLAYVRDHPKVFSVTVIKGKDGLIDFTIKHDVTKPMYHVAHLAVYHQGRLIAKSDTPSFGKKQGNTFYFSLAAADIAASTFDLSDSGLGSDLNGVQVDIPVVGSEVYQFRLLDFVPEGMLKSTLGK